MHPSTGTSEIDDLPVEQIRYKFDTPVRESNIERQKDLLLHDRLRMKLIYIDEIHSLPDEVKDLILLELRRVRRDKCHSS